MGKRTVGSQSPSVINAYLTSECVGVGSTVEITDVNSYWEKTATEWVDLGYIEGQVFNSIAKRGDDLVQCNGEQTGKHWHYKNCVFDARSIPLDDQDEAFSVVRGANAVLENCIIIGAKKAILCGSGDAGDWGGSLTMQNCILLNCGRRTPEAQQGYTVNMHRCWIHNWGVESAFDVRAFATWSHDEANIQVTDCIFTRNTGLGVNNSKDIAEWIGWYTNEFGAIAALSQPRYGVSGSLRAIETIGDGNVGASHNYRNQDDFVAGGSTTWSMTKGEADLIIQTIALMLPDTTPYVGVPLIQYWNNEV